MSTTKTHPSGAWEVCAIVGGYLTRRTYYGYTRREAMEAFALEFPNAEAL